MAYRPYGSNGTIVETLQAVNHGKLVLPAIQREFVWDEDQICRFFDSLMQGYPFGTFLYWDVDATRSGDFKWYGLVRDYHERNNPYCPILPVMHNTPLTAILDGQQRLTALNIGLQGSMAWKIPYGRYNNPDAFPVRHLYVNLLEPTEPDENGIRYDFMFRREGNQDQSSDDECWFKVADILGMQSGPSMYKWLTGRGLSEDQVYQAFEVLNELHQVVHTRSLVFCYEEKEQDIEKVLQIFIRLNNGGTALSYSDLLLSVASAQWEHLDARNEVHNLVDDLNSIGGGFRFPKDFVLKAGLVLNDLNIGFVVRNFNRENMEKLEEHWQDVRQTLLLTVELAARFGFNGDNLNAHNSLLPIAYYLYHTQANTSILTHSTYDAERKSIQSWLVRSLVKRGIWGSGLDTLLTALRRVIQDQAAPGFPVTSLEKAMGERGKSLIFTEEEIEDIADLQYGDRRVFLLLSLLFPFIDLANNFHVDHIFPRSKMYTAEEDIDYYEVNGLANLQLLEGAKNVEKQAMLPAEWLEQHFSNDMERSQYVQNHLLGQVPDDLDGFGEFYETRRERLKERIVELFGQDSHA